MILSFAFVNVPVMPVRSEPNHRAEQTNQLLFGEKADILEINNKDWAKIIGIYDGYTGWCKTSQLKIVTKKEYQKNTKYIVTSYASKLITNSGMMWLPVGSELTGLKSGKITILNEPGVFKGKKTAKDELELSSATLKNVALQYIYAPYQWGGRTVAGIDCSGFTQMVFKLCNHKLPRDAYQQATHGKLVDFLPNSKAGDLAFFDDKEGKITHVGMLLDNHTIIHAADSTGCVAIDKIDQGGIVSIVQKKRTHNLRFVKRILVD